MRHDSTSKITIKRHEGGHIVNANLDKLIPRRNLGTLATTGVTTQIEMDLDLLMIYLKVNPSDKENYFYPDPTFIRKPLPQFVKIGKDPILEVKCVGSNDFAAVLMDEPNKPELTLSARDGK